MHTIGRRRDCGAIGRLAELKTVGHLDIFRRSNITSGPAYNDVKRAAASAEGFDDNYNDHGTAL
jgi:hypothetical protein